MNFDSKIQFINQTTTKNAHGEDAVQFTGGAYAWANVNYKGGLEGFMARQTVASGNIVFKIRYMAGIKETMFISYNNKLYNIRHIAENGRLNILEISAEFHDNLKTDLIQ